MLKSIDLSGFLNDLLKNDAILVINKSDLLKEKLDPEISKFNHVLISLKDNLNIDKLISKIKNNLKNKFITEEDILITRERHRQHLVQCVDHLKIFWIKMIKKILIKQLKI
jgi:tRNA modification GTPase